MDKSATAATRFAPPAVPAPLPLEASFDGGRLTSDGGLPWVGASGGGLGVSAPWPRRLRSGAGQLGAAERERRAQPPQPSTAWARR